MADPRREFVVARNPEEGTTLPYLLYLPLVEGGVVLKARETWPRVSKVYCHPATDGWPAQAEEVERVPVRACFRRGSAIDLVLDRGRENRSQFVFTRVQRGREAIFWQTASTSRKARPLVRMPTAAVGPEPLQIIIDDRERYPYRFAQQRVEPCRRRRLPAGDYAVELDGEIVAAVERKSMPDLIQSLTTGKLGFALAELASLPRAAVVVEDRYSRLLSDPRVRPSTLLNALAETQVRWPAVPVMFCETRKLAEEWVYRYLATAHAELADRAEPRQLPTADAPAARPSVAEIRAWARARGWPVSDRGRVPADIVTAFLSERGAAT